MSTTAPANVGSSRPTTRASWWTGPSSQRCAENRPASSFVSQALRTHRLACAIALGTQWGGRAARSVRRRRLAVTAPGQLEFVDDELPEPPDGTLLLRTEATGLSAGTELAFVKGDHPALHSGWTPSWAFSSPRRPTPVTRCCDWATWRSRGCSTPERRRREGDLVATAYGHRNGAPQHPVREHVVPLPPELDPLLGVFVAHLGRSAQMGCCTPPQTLCGTGVRPRRRGIRPADRGGRRRGRRPAHRTVRPDTVRPRSWCSTRRRSAARPPSGSGLGPLARRRRSGRTLKVRWRHGPGDHGADVVFQCRGRPRRWPRRCAWPAPRAPSSTWPSIPAARPGAAR